MLSLMTLPGKSTETHHDALAEIMVHLCWFSRDASTLILKIRSFTVIKRSVKRGFQTVDGDSRRSRS